MVIPQEKQQLVEEKDAGNIKKELYLFDSPPWALIKFLDLESGRLFEAGRLLNLFQHFQQVKYVYFATKQ